jgi:hypothetical protein
VLAANSSGLNIERSNSLAHGEEIRALFRRNNRAHFDGVFDRAYPYAYSVGGASWVARDADGIVVGHVAAFPRVFRNGSRPVRGALLVDCLFDRVYRNFLLPVQLCRRVTADLRAAGDFDFAYTDPTPPAVPVNRAAGLVAFGALRRLVMPAYPLYVRLFELRAGAERLSVERVSDPYDDRVVQTFPLLTGGGFRAERSPALYAAHLGGDATTCELLVFRPASGPGGEPAALAVTVRQPGSPALIIADVLWDETRVSATSVLIAAAKAAWAGGHTRVSIFTLVPSAFAENLKRCGFVRRRDVLPIYLLRFGEVVLPAPERWLLTSIDGSGW